MILLKVFRIYAFKHRQSKLKLFLRKSTLLQLKSYGFPTRYQHRASHIQRGLPAEPSRVKGIKGSPHN